MREVEKNRSKKCDFFLRKVLTARTQACYNEGKPFAHPPLGGEGGVGVSLRDTPLYSCAVGRVKLFLHNFFFFSLHFFLVSGRFPAYSVRMNSMIDPQNEVASFATVAPEEFYGAYNGTEDSTVDNVPTCDDVAEPVYDDVADDANQYVDDVY